MKNGLTKLLGIGAIAAATAFMPMKAKADIVYYETQTTITAIDDNKDNITDRYQFDWRVDNESSSSTGTEFYGFGTQDTKLSTRGLSVPTTSFMADWDYSESTTNSLLTMPSTGGIPIYQSAWNTFTSYVDAEDVIGFEEIGTKVTGNFGEYAIDSLGGSLSLNDAVGTHEGFFTSQIPEPMTIGLLASGALVTLLGRRIKEDHRY